MVYFHYYHLPKKYDEVLFTYDIFYQIPNTPINETFIIFIFVYAA